MKKNYLKIVIDLLMAITFVLLMNPRVLNGLPFHEIAGLAIGVAILTHIGLNYRWVINTTVKIFDPKLPKKTRFSFGLNILLLISMSAVIITGIFISRVVFPNLAIEGNRWIRGIHSLSADSTLAIVGIHLGVHWQWIMSIFKRMFKSKEGKLRITGIVSAVLVFALLGGGIQWFSTSAASAPEGFKPNPFQERNDSRSAIFNKNTANNQPVFNNNQSNFKRRPGRDFNEHHGARSPFLVILNYFAILAVLIIPTYYVEKRILRKKRQTNMQSS